MDKNFSPTLLKNKARLQEIYDLRVTAYENSPKQEFVNRKIFPNGLSDILDERDETFHWIIEDDNKIIASARIAICNHLEELSNDISSTLQDSAIPKTRPFAYYSRLVIHQDYRKLGLVEKLDKIRVDFLKNDNTIPFSIAWATKNRHLALQNLGFIKLGEYNYNWGGSKNQVQAMFILNLTHQS